MIWTINLYDAAVVWTNPRLCNWLLEWVIDSARNRGMNIFGVDFFDVLDNRVVNTIVALNKAPASPKDTGHSFQEIRDTPYFRDNDSFSEAAARKTLASVGLELKKYEREYKEMGALRNESFIELESKGIPKVVVLEYIRWYESQTRAK